ncbi:MAG: FAD-binding protein [Novosphingobium sp.]|nr:FAD-binding protein [Novosphingobium sp.]
MNNLQTDFTSQVEPPLVLDDPENASWQDSADIVLIGFGGAAAAAGLQAREDGASVLALDRFAGGGATAFSGGVVYAGGTKYQQEAGFDDDAGEMFKYLSFEGTAVRPETLKRFCDESNANVEWIIGHGVEMEASFYPHRAAYPPDGFYLYYTGMEAFRGEVARPAPRGHRTVGKGPTGKYYWAAMQRSALESGVRVRPHTPVRRLVLDAKGRAIGIECQVIPEQQWKRHDKLYKRVDPYRPFGGPRAEKAIAECRAFEESLPPERILIRAERAVIIAAGNYTYNLELLSRHRPEFAACVGEMTRGGSMGCDGSGLELGLSVGGQLAKMDAVALMRSLSPPRAFVQGVLVNAEGRRYINEDAYLGTIGQATAEQPGYDAWLILDSATFWQGVRQLLPPGEMFSWWGMPAWLNLLFGGTRRASSYAKLAAKCGLPADVLEAEVVAHNRGFDDGSDPYGKRAEYSKALASGSCYALNMSFRNKWSFSSGMPFGGLKVDEDSGAVTDGTGAPIPGLFACGRSAVGISSGATFSGLSIGDTIFSGRRAARAALHGQTPI